MGDGEAERSQRKRELPLGGNAVFCSDCGAEHDAFAGWYTRCLKRCARGVPVGAAEQGRVWHRCGEGVRQFLRKTGPVCCRCGGRRDVHLRLAEKARQRRAQASGEGRRIDRDESAETEPSSDSGASSSTEESESSSASSGTEESESSSAESCSKASTAEMGATLSDGGARMGEADAAVAPAAAGMGRMGGGRMAKRAAETGAGGAGAPWGRRLRRRAAGGVRTRQGRRGASATGSGGASAISSAEREPVIEAVDAARGVRRADADETRTSRPGWPLEVLVPQVALLELWFAAPPPLRYIPRGARVVSAEVYARQLRAVKAEPDNENAWRVLLALPRLLFCRGAEVAEAAEDLWEGGARAEGRVAVALEEARRSPLRRGPGDADVVEYAAKLAKEGMTVRALETLARPPATDLLEGASAEEMVERMLPSAKNVMPRRTRRLLKALGKLPPDAAMRINWGKAIRQAEPRRAPGPDGLRNEHLTSMAAAPLGVGREFIAAFGDFAELLLRGDVPCSVRPFLAAARICFIPKETGGVRPLGVVSALRRVIVKAAARLAAPKVSSWLLARGQLGVGAAAGTEGLARMVQDAFDEGDITLLLDRINAYSTLDVEAVRIVAGRLMPEWLPMVDMLLCDAIIVGGAAGKRWAGLFMGCPFSPLLYALTLEAALDKVRRKGVKVKMAGGRGGEESRAVKVKAKLAGFLDDGAITARTREEAEVVLRRVSRAGQAVGQRTNLAKSATLSREPLAVPLPGIPIANQLSDGKKVVGVPVGRMEWRRAKAEEIVAARLAERQRLFAHPAMGAAARIMLMRTSRGWPEVAHLFRSLPPSETAEMARALDEARDATIAAEMVLAPAEARALPLWPTVGMPRRRGGLGIYAAKDVAAAAFVAGQAQAERLLETMKEVAASGGGSVPTTRSRASGRPEHGAGGRGGCCLCMLKVEPRCTKRRCATCCNLEVEGPCEACAAVADAELDAPEVRRRMEKREDAVGAYAAATGVGLLAARRTVAVALRYEQPQRALTQALLGRARQQLEVELREKRLAREMTTLVANANPGVRAVWDAVPVGLTGELLKDDVIMVALRSAFAVPVLPARAMSCVMTATTPTTACPVARISRESAGLHAADRHSRCCKRGGGTFAVHDSIAATLGTVAAEWGLGVAMATKHFLPPDRAFKMDVLVRGAGIGGRFLAIDVTRREAPEDVAGARMDAADAEKEAKYMLLYAHPVTVLAFAMDHRGRLSDDALKAVDLLVAAGARMCGGHPDDLRRDLLVRLAAEVQHDLAFYYAVTAAVSGCSAPGVPDLASLRIRGPLFRACPGYLRPRAQPRPPPWRKAS